MLKSYCFYVVPAFYLKTHTSKPDGTLRKLTGVTKLNSLGDGRIK
jgi:hypothetical protein